MGNSASVTNESVKSVAEVGGNKDGVPHATKSYSPTLKKTIEEAIIDGSIGSDADISTLDFRTSLVEDFQNTSTVTKSVANSTGVEEDGVYKIQYDNVVITVVTNNVTLGAAPNFTVQEGDVFVQGDKHTVILTVNSQTDFDVEDGSLLSNGSSIVSQKYESIDLNSISGLIDGETVVLSSIFTEQIKEMLLFYRDGYFEQSSNEAVIGWSATSEGTDWIDTKTRSMVYANNIESAIFNLFGTILKLRFFAVKTTGNGELQLKKYKTYFHK